MIKKVIAIIISIAMLLSVAACSNVPENTSNAKVYGMYATEKYMLDKTIDSEENKSLTFTGIKNEVQSAQITFTALKDINSFNLVVDDLQQVGGESILSKDLFSVYAERYVEIYNPFMSDASYISEAGFYPDALVPLDKYQIREEDRVKKGNNQALWIDVTIPVDISAGSYNGKFVLELNDEKIDIDVSVKIYDLVMPDEVNWPTIFAIWYQNIANGEGDNLDENTYKTYYEFLWSKRLNGADVPPQYTGDMNSFVAHIETIWNNPKVTGYRIPGPTIIQNKIDPKMEGEYTQEQIETEKLRIKNDLKAKMKRLLDRSLELRSEEGKETTDLLDKAYFYYEDEPTRGQRTNCVRIFCELLNTAKKELATEYAEIFSVHKDLLESLMDIDEICPSNYFFDDSLTVSENSDGTPNYEKSDGLTWWCPEADFAFDSTARREMIQKRQELGEKVWWYLCVSNTPRPSYYVESLPINIRMMSWQQYRWNVQGLLYWDICDYQSGQDMYEDVQYSNFGGGEGILVYPGVRYGMKTPISSWRMEQIRLGQQDLELFTMLENYMINAGCEKTARDVAIAMGDTMYEGTTIKESTTSKQLEDHRIMILDIVEMFSAGKTNEAISKINEII